jgi:hypothetical protein
MTLPADTNIFASGNAQNLGNNQSESLINEISARAGGPVVIREATESIVVFSKPNGTTFRVAYYKEPMSGQFMFGKPERVIARMTYIPLTSGPRPLSTQPLDAPEAARRPNATNPPRQPYPAGVPDETPSLAFGIVLPKEEDKSDSSWIDQESWDDQTPVELLIKCSIENAFQTKSYLDPIFNYHRLESEVTENGILITSPLSPEAYDALDIAVKGLGRIIGRALVPGGGRKKEDAPSGR